MTFADYQQIPAINWTTLKEMRRSPRRYQYRLSNPLEDSTRLAFGRAVHTAILEPDQFPLDYAVFLGGRRAGKKWDEFEAANEGRTILKAEEYQQCIAMRDAVRSHPAAAALLRQGKSEMTITWTDPATGLPCKGRLDWLGECLVDLKTTTDVDAGRFGATAARLGYHSQLAFYLNGLRARGITVPAKVIAVEVDEPHDVAVFVLDDAAMYAGEQEVAELLAKVKECRTVNQWPGRYEGEQVLEIPSWALGSDDDDSGLDLMVSGQEV